MLKPYAIQFLSFALVVFYCGTGFAQVTPYTKNRNMIVSLEITGRNNLGQDIGTYGTGFIINKSGFMITAAHVYEDLIKKGASKETIKITAHISDFTGSAVTAVFVESNNHDVAILKLEPKVGGYPAIQGVCNTGLQISSTKVYTSGFPYICSAFEPQTKSCLKGKPRYVQNSGETGSIDDSQLPDAFDVNLRFDYGASGSPVYLENGTIVGIAKGIIEDTEYLGVFIPISWAEGLLKGIPNMPECSDISACINSKISNFSTDKFNKSGGARAGGPGTSSDPVIDSQNVCYSPPPGYSIDGQVTIIDNGNNGGRGNISAATYTTDASGRVNGVCVTAKAWSEAKLFGAGGWQNVTLSGVISKKASSPQDFDKAKSECLLQN